MNHKIAFVINPKAGVKKNIDLNAFIHEHFKSPYPFKCIVWENKDDFDSIKQQLLTENYTIAVACGGDGTVNKVASVVVNTTIALGILPLGSGNGLARSNKIPMDLKQALQVISNGSLKKMDSATLNGIPYFCTAGIGFDALIANAFATSTKRGLATYITTTIKEFFSYQPNQYQIDIDGKSQTTTAFLITLANAGQWGNDVYIAPGAKLDDGLIRVCILKPFPLWQIPVIATKLILKKIDQSAYLETIIGKKISITYNQTLPVHFDGEPILIAEKLFIEIHPLSLNIVC